MPIDKDMPQYQLAASVFRKRLLSLIPPEQDLKSVAKTCRIPYTTFYKYVHGRFLPSVPALMCICHGFGVTPNYLLGFDREVRK